MSLPGTSMWGVEAVGLGQGRSPGKPELSDPVHPSARAAGMSPGEWVVLCACSAAVVGVQALQWPLMIEAYFLNRDAAAYALIGKVLSAGGTPYVSYWDHKPPLIHLINALGFLLAGGSLWGVWLTSAAALLATIVLGYAALRSAVGVRGAWLGSAFCVVGAWWSIEGGNLTETYALPLAWLSVLVLLIWADGRAGGFTAGALNALLGGLALLLRPNLIGASLCVMFVMTIIYAMHGHWRAVGRVVLGAVVGGLTVALALWAYLLIWGAVWPFADQVLHYNQVYSSVSWAQRGAGLLQLALKVPGSPILVIAWVVTCVAALRGRVRAQLPLAPLLLAVVWLPMECLMASLSGRAYAHYCLPLLPPSALLLGLLAEGTVWRQAVEIRPVRIQALNRGLVAVIGIAIVGPTAIRMAVYSVNMMVPVHARSVLAAAKVVRDHATSDESVFVWGAEPDVYLLADRAPASRFIYAYPLLTSHYADSALIASLLDDLRQRPPAIIVDASPTDPLVPSLGALDTTWSVGQYTVTPALLPLRQLVLSDYQPLASRGPGGWTFYVRRTDVGDSP